MTGRGNYICVKLKEPYKLTIGRKKKKKVLCKYKFKINNASYLTITNRSLEGAQRIADRSAKRSTYNEGSAVLFTITKIYEST